MKTNGKPTTERTAGCQLPPFGQPKSQPLVKAEQIVNDVNAKFAIIERKQELETQRMLSNVAVVKSALPVIEKIVGDPNVNLGKLTDVIKARGCDICEDCIEISVED